VSSGSSTSQTSILFVAIFSSSFVRLWDPFASSPTLLRSAITNENSRNYSQARLQQQQPFARHVCPTNERRSPYRVPKPWSHQHSEEVVPGFEGSGGGEGGSAAYVTHAPEHREHRAIFNRVSSRFSPLPTVATKEQWLTAACHVFADNENRRQEVEHHKQDQLQKQKEGKGHWKDELASNSESIVRLLPFPSRLEVYWA
jgi:hypothetical protein